MTKRKGCEQKYGYVCSHAELAGIVGLLPSLEKRVAIHYNAPNAAEVPTAAKHEIHGDRESIPRIIHLSAPEIVS